MSAIIVAQVFRNGNSVNWRGESWTFACGEVRRVSPQRFRQPLFCSAKSGKRRARFATATKRLTIRFQHAKLAGFDHLYHNEKAKGHPLGAPWLFGGGESVKNKPVTTFYFTKQVIVNGYRLVAGVEEDNQFVIVQIDSVHKNID